PVMLPVTCDAAGITRLETNARTRTARIAIREYIILLKVIRHYVSARDIDVKFTSVSSRDRRTADVVLFCVKFDGTRQFFQPTIQPHGLLRRDHVRKVGSAVGEMIFDVIEYVDEVSSANGASLRITALLENGLKIIE